MSCSISVCEKLQLILAQQKIIERLPEYSCLILASFAFFCVLSWGTYYLAAPSLLNYSSKVRTDQDAAATRLKWGHHLCALLHSVVSACASPYLLYTCDWNDSLKERVWGHHPSISKVFAFMMGHFLWDICSCLYSTNIYGISYSIHAIMVLATCVAVFKPLLQRHAFNFLPLEFSSIFLNLHWVLVQTGFGQSRALLAIDALGLITYLIFRVIWGPYTSYLLLKDLWDCRFELGSAWTWFVAVILLTSNFLNFYWFYTLVRVHWKTYLSSKSALMIKTQSQLHKKAI